MNSQTCSEKACPFPPSEGEKMCRHHRQFFAYDVSLTDRGIDLANLVTPYEGSAVLRVISPNRYPQTAEERRLSLHHQLLASGTLVHGLITEMKKMGEDDRSLVLSPPYELDARDLFRTVRYPNGVFCCLCGSFDVKKLKDTSSADVWFCRRCRYEIWTKSLTIFHRSRNLYSWWMKAVWITFNDHDFGLRTRISNQLDCNVDTAAEVNRKIRMAGEVVGLSLGYDPSDALAKKEYYKRTGTFVKITHCKRGHILSEDNVYHPKSNPDWRVCLKCRSMSRIGDLA